MPIDHVVRGIAALLEVGAQGGQIVHLAAREAVAAARFLGLIGHVQGLRSPRIITPQRHEQSVGSVAERLARPYWGYFRRHPEFATYALADLTGIAAPQWDDAALLRQIAFCAKAGFLRTGLAATAAQRISG